jgi:hypothetical protein
MIVAGGFFGSLTILSTKSAMDRILQVKDFTTPHLAASADMRRSTPIALSACAHFSRLIWILVSRRRRHVCNDLSPSENHGHQFARNSKSYRDFHAELHKSIFATWTIALTFAGLSPSQQQVGGEHATIPRSRKNHCDTGHVVRASIEAP